MVNLKEKAQKIGEIAKKATKTSLIIHCENTAPSLLTIKLATEAQKNYHLKVICLCFGSQAALDGVPFTKDFLGENCNIIKMLPPGLDKTKFIPMGNNDQKLDLQSTLISAILIHYANTNNGLVLGILDKTSLAERVYYKYAEGLADIFPLLDTYYSECEEAVKKLYPKHSFINLFTENNKIDIEWAVKEHEKTGILLADNAPSKDKNWFKYTLRQKQILSYLYERWKTTSHKQHLKMWPD